MSRASLPPELWLTVFRWATLSKATQSLYAIEYLPFQSDSSYDYVDDAAFATKCAIVSVCKQWKCLAKDLLLEDVIIDQGGNKLKEVLQLREAGQDQDGFRKVRRACLPYSSCTPWNTELRDAAEIVQSCPQLEVLVRPFRPRAEEMRFEIAADECPSLTSLKRLDWWHYNDAARSGGFNSLTDVLHCAPNLQYLTLSGDLWLSLMHRAPIQLPSLTTLRLRRMNVLFLQQVCRWHMPALRHVVLDTYTSTPRLLEAIWDTFGPQFETVELGRSLKFYVLDLICHILTRCPNLKELSYYTQFTATPQPPVDRHLHLTTVRMHAHPNEFVAAGSSAFWEHVEEHFTVFCKPFFPALQRIVLHGDWQPYLVEPRYLAIADTLQARGYSLELDPIT